MKHLLSFDNYICENKIFSTNDLIELNIEILNENNEISIGKIIVHKDIKNDIINIFNELKNIGYPIECMRPISEFNNNDDESMENNNTYSYCHRFIRNTNKLSAHSFGLCIDINPKYNPCVRFNEDGTIKSVFPENGEKYSNRNIENPYKITNEIVSIFNKYGFSWGGNWKNTKDYQHFERKDLIDKYKKER